MTLHRVKICSREGSTSENKENLLTVLYDRLVKIFPTGYCLKYNTFIVMCLCDNDTTKIFSKKGNKALQANGFMPIIPPN